MDPISFLFLTGVLTSVAGNRADAALRWLYDRVRSADPPIRTLGVAVRRAYLQATLLLFTAYLKELGEPVGLVQKKVQRLQGLFSKTEPDSLRWAKKTKELLEEELRNLTRNGTIVFQSQNLDPAFQTVLSVTHSAAANQQEILITELKKLLLRELESIGSSTPEAPLGLIGQSQIPPRFLEMLMNGWYEAASYNSTVYMEWFQFFCTFFSHLLNTNDQLRDLVGKQLMPPDVEGLTVPAFQQQLLTFGEELGLKVGTAFKELHEHIEAAYSEHQQQVLDVQTRLNDVLPYVALLPEMWQELNISRVAQFIENELATFEQTRYLGSEIANRETKLISELPAIFIGRDDDQNQLTRFINENKSGLLLLTGEAGFGKTSLLLNWISELQEENCFVAYHFFSTKYDVTRSISSALTHLLQQLYQHWQLANRPLPTGEQALKDTLVGLLREKMEESNERVVIVLDALDEAEKSLDPPVPLPLPKGLFVIASARASAGESPLYLMYWGEQNKRMHLSPLSKQDVVRWMKRAGGGELIEFANDKYSAQNIYERTGGFPLFLHYLIPQLVQTIRSDGDIQRVLDETPLDFREYVATQFNRLKYSSELRNATGIQGLFSVLTAAKGPIDENDLSQVTRLNVWEIGSLPWQVSRWISTQRRDGVTTYTFAHRLLADAFSTVLQNQALQAREALAEYCSRWAEHQSQYALKHYAEHLWELKRHEKLLELARDVDFAQLQKSLLPYLPDLQLTTTQQALKSALELNDLQSVASLMLGHLKLVEDTTAHQTPLELFNDGDLSGAWLSAENFDGNVPILWRLSIIRKLVKQGRITEAEARLRSLNTESVTLVGKLDEGQFCVTLLAGLENVDDDLMFDIASKLLAPYHVRTLVIALAHQGRSLSLAQRLTKVISGDNRNKAIGVMAQAFARAGDWDTALKSVDGIYASFTRAWALSDLVRIALKQQDVSQAESLIAQLKALNETRIYHTSDKIKSRPIDTTWQTALAYAAVGSHLYFQDEKKGKEYLRDAEELIDHIQQSSIRGRALTDLALIYWFLEQRETAYFYLREAEKIAKQLRYPRECARLLTYIGRCYADMDKGTTSVAYIDEAVGLVSQIVEPEPRAEVLKECAIDYVYAGETAKAINAALQVRLGERTREAFQEIARLLVERDQTEEAHGLAERFRQNKFARTSILIQISSGLMNLGREDEAEAVLSEALNKMRFSLKRGAQLHALHCLACLAKAQFLHGNSSRGNASLAVLLERLERTRGLTQFWAVLNTVPVIGPQLEPQAVEGLLQSAYEVTQQSGRPAKRVWLLSLLAQVAFTLGFSERSEEWFAEAEGLIDEVADVWEKLNAFQQLSETLTAAGQTRRAGKFLESARKIALGMSLFRSRARELAKLSLTYAKTNRFDDAVLLAKTAGVSSAKEARRALSIVYAHDGKILDALNEMGRIANPRERAQAIRDIALVATRKNDLALALELAKRLHTTHDGRGELFRILRTVREAGHQEAFSDLIPLCIHTYGLVYEVIGELALNDPSQAAQLEEVFQQHTKFLKSAPSVVDSVSILASE